MRRAASLGRLVEVFRAGENEVYRVEADGRPELLLPALRDVVREIDLEAGTHDVRYETGGGSLTDAAHRRRDPLPGALRPAAADLGHRARGRARPDRGGGARPARARPRPSSVRGRLSVRRGSGDGAPPRAAVRRGEPLRDGRRPGDPARPGRRAPDRCHWPASWPPQGTWRWSAGDTRGSTSGREPWPTARSASATTC